MKVTFLGTSSSFPTKDRSHPAILLNYNGESFLFDCGEGTQRQFRISKESPMKVSKIFLSHWHGDHVFGLPGLLESMSMSRRITTLNVYGPIGTAKNFKKMFEAFNIKLSFRIKIHEFTAKKPKKIVDGENYEVYAYNLIHSIPCIGYYFKEKSKKRLKKDILSKFGLENNPIVKKLLTGKSIETNGEIITPKKATYNVEGKKISIILDTEYFKELEDFVKNSDLLIAEGTFSNKLKEEAKKKGGHLTIKQAAKIAKNSNSKQLAICHLSQRYKNTKELEKEAESVFKNTIFAKDFSTISI